MSIEETLEDLGAAAAELRAGSGAERWRYLVQVFRAGDDELPSPRARWTLDGRDLVIGRRPGPNGVELDDAAVSREHAALEYDASTNMYRLVDRESRNGTYLDGRRTTSALLRHGAVIRIGGSLFVYVDQLVPKGLVTDPGPVAIARAVAEATADLAAPAELSVLLIGPTGSGKEVLARRIHEKSGRSGPFVAVNCATLTRELIASELFGHTAGAFSGAVRSRSGLFVTANGGTLLLDEVAELPLDQQAALLRALQEKRVRPVGSDQEVPVDVRVVAATHQSLDVLEREGRFRADLHARLAGFVIELPGLTERREEILHLFHQFLGTPKKRLTRDAAETLLVHDYSHNVRMLRHAAERAKLVSQSAREIDVAQLPPALQRRASGLADTLDESAAWAQRGAEPPAAPPSSPSPPASSAAQVEAVLAKELAPTKEELITLLHRYGGNIAQICRATGKHRQQVYRWLKKHDLDLDQFRPDGET